jgi:predicted phage terminase large subunit-like protein
MTDQQKLAAKALAETSLLTFMRIFWQFGQGERMKCNWHVRYLASILQDVLEGNRRNVIFNVCPGAGKTEMFSIALQAYARLVTHNAGRRCRFLSLSYADSLVKRNSKRVRDMIKSREFQFMCPSVFASDAMDEWSIVDDRGRTSFEVVSKSTGGQVVGSRAGFINPEFTGAIVLDDPSKPDFMFSPVRRDAANRLLVDTVRSRRADKSKDTPTPIILIMQRLHKEDASGFLLGGHMGIDFERIVIPALIDQQYIDALPEGIRQHCMEDICGTEQIDGKWSFWPETESISGLMALQNANKYTFASQYLQEPITIGGQIINPDGFVWYGDGGDIDRPITMEYRFITADTAQKIQDHNDWSVFCCWGVWMGKLYLMDLLRDRWEAPELRVNFINFIQKQWGLNTTGNHGVLRNVYVEDKVSGSGMIQEAARHAPLPITPVQRGAGQNKLVRAMDASPQVAMGNVCLPVGEPWVMGFVTEVGSFTADDTHQFDDQTDNLLDAVEIAITRPGQSVVNMLLSSKQRNRAGL